VRGTSSLPVTIGTIAATRFAPPPGDATARMLAAHPSRLGGGALLTPILREPPTCKLSKDTVTIAIEQPDHGW